MQDDFPPSMGALKPDDMYWDRCKTALPLTCVITADTAWGEDMRLVGDTEELGEWDPLKGVPLRTSESAYPLWFACQKSAAAIVAWGTEKVIECKFVAVLKDGSARWESGANRIISLPMQGGVFFARFGDQAQCCGESIPTPLNIIGFPGCLAVWEITCNKTDFGDELVVAGSSLELGQWNPEKGVALRATEGSFPRWIGCIPLPTDPEGTCWKLVIRRADGRVDWEDGPNRSWVSHRVGHSLEVYLGRGIYGNKDAYPLVQRNSSVLPMIAEESDLVAFDGARAGLSSLGIRRLSTLSTCSTGAGGADDDASMISVSTVTATHPEILGSRFWAGAACFGKTASHCEDAFFVTPFACGVADGVGSMSRYAKHGVDVAAYSNELMEIASRSLNPGGRAWLETSESCPDARAAAAMRYAEREASFYGASTMTVAHVSGSNLGVASLGDSGFMILRNQRRWEVVTRSCEQQHLWNFPYQLMRIPPSLTLPSGAQCDTAADCDQYHFPVKPGDLVLLFTDGLSDNLHENEIINVVQRVCATASSRSPRSPRPRNSIMSALPNPDVLARAIARAAQMRARDPIAETPFSFASKQHGQPHTGGKEDDITVIAGWVMQ